MDALNKAIDDAALAFKTARTDGEKERATMKVDDACKRIENLYGERGKSFVAIQKILLLVEKMGDLQDIPAAQNPMAQSRVENLYHKLWKTPIPGAPEPARAAVATRGEEKDVSGATSTHQTSSKAEKASEGWIRGIVNTVAGAYRKCCGPKPKKED